MPHNENDATFAKLRATLNKLDTYLEQLQDGDAPYLDPDIPEDKLVIDQIHAFYPEGKNTAYELSLDSRPEMYYITPQQKNKVVEGKTLEKWIQEADTSVHPLHLNLSNAAESMRRGASLNDVTNYVSAGADPHFRNRVHFNNAFDRSPNLFLHAKGDVVSLAQTVKLMKQALGDDDQAQRAIVIDNTTGRFTPLLTLLNLDFDEGVNWLNDALKKQGKDVRIGVVDKPKTGISKLKSIGFATEHALPALPPIDEKLSPFFKTGSEEKEHDTSNAITYNKLDITLRHADDLAGHSEHAAEWKWSYGGNALDKLKLTLKDKIESPELDEQLSALELTRKNAFIMVADGGEDCFDRRLRSTKTFEDVLSLSHPLSEFPGSETKPVAQRHGVKEDGYYKRDAGYKELDGDVDTRIVDNCVVIIAPLEQEDPEKPVYYAFKSKQVIEQVFEPAPAYHTHYTQRHFQKPEGMAMTLAGLEEDQDPWMQTNLAIASAFLLMARTCGVQTKDVELGQHFNKKNRLPVACPWPLPEGSSLPAKLKKNDIAIQKTDKPVESFDDVRKFMRNNKGYIFPRVPLAEGENYWMSRIVLPSSLYVAKQLRDPHVNGNPMATYSKVGEKRPDVEQMFDHLKRSAMISQDPHYMYNRASKVSSASKYLKRMSSVHNPSHEVETARYTPLPDTGKKHVVLFLLSASGAHPFDNDDAYSAAVNIGLNHHKADQPVLMKSGMGWAHPMGWNVMGGLQLIREGFTGIDVQGVQDPFAMKTEGYPEEEMLKYMGKGHALVAPDIFVRMEQLLGLDTYKAEDDVQLTVINMANGAGGLQESASFLALRKQEHPLLTNANFIVQNRPRDGVNGSIAPHDVLLKKMEKQGDMWNVEVCETVQEMMQSYERMTGIEMTYFDIPRPTDTLFPFAREKNPHYEWFMGAEHSDAPAQTIRDVYEETLLGPKVQNDNDQDHDFELT